MRFRTHNIIAGARRNSGEHLPYTANKAAKLGVDIRVLVGEELGDLTNRGANFLKRAGRSLLVVVILQCQISQSDDSPP